MMRKIILLLLVFAYSCSDNSKGNGKELNDSKIKQPSSFFPEEKAKILLVGTFHMSYPNRDAIKVAEDEMIDVLKEPKKSEITELVEYIKKFNPTKVAVEKSNNWNHKILTRYKTGEFVNNRDETYQLGARVASEMKHDTIYAINSWSMYSDLKAVDSTYIETI